MPRANLLYLTYNSSADIEHLPALVLSAGEDLPVLALDNDSRDNSVARLLHLCVSPLALTTNLGFTAGMNLLLVRLVEHNAVCDEADRVEWAVIANPDVRAKQDGWVTELLNVPGDCGIVGARLTDGMRTLGGGVINPSKMPLVRSLWRSIGIGSEVLCPSLLGWSRVSQEVGGPTDYTEEREVPWAAFALCALRMSMVEEIGLLDEDYWHFVSDQEYCLRAWTKGWSVRYKPITFVHPSNTALGTAPGEAQVRVANDIRLWCEREDAYLRSSRWV
jgi:GT2 family glycosyltransferase